MKQILVVDDDVAIGNLLEETLRQAGYEVLRAYSGTEALLLLAREKPDLVLLDRMLPGLQGEAVLPQIRGVPVIILSARADAEEKAELLLGGAADYITKPFHTRELLARVAVQLRGEPGGIAPLRVGELTLDPDTHAVSAGDASVHLTRTEFAILKLLMQNPGQVIPKSRLLDRISEDTPDCTESSLKIHVSNLRKKLRTLSDRDYIEAVWGIGFRIREDS